MRPIFTKGFWADATERAIKTAAQSVILSIGTSEIFNVFTLNAKIVAGYALGGAVLSYLSSIVSAQVGNPNSASLVETK